MKTRRKAREAALQALYQCDVLSDWSQSAVDLYFQIYQDTSEHSDSTPENRQFAKLLAFGVISHLNLIDQKISEASNHWTIARMSLVDRNLIRLASFEILFMDDVPTNVSINEAIEIAKKYGSEESPMFINGVLDKIASQQIKKDLAV